MRYGLGLWMLVAVGCQVEPAEAPVDDAIDEEEPLDQEWPGDAPDDMSPAPLVHHVYDTCGDPVCSGWRDKGLYTCPPWVTEGMGCYAFMEGWMCDPGDFCNSVYTCALEDPAAGPCPISLRDAKQDIAYVDEDQRKQLAADLAKFKLATYRYKGGTDEHLGFIIDDVAPSPAVRASGDRVDLYAYTTMAVAALQEQQAQIDALKAEIAELKAQR